MLLWLRPFVVGLLAAVACSCGWAQTEGANYPQRALRLILPYAAGQGADASARRLAAQLSRQMQQPVTLENMAGAGGAIGTQALVHSPADGYTLLYGLQSNVVLAPLLNPAVGFASGDLQPVGMVALDSMTLVSDPARGAAALADLQALARSPRGLKFGFMGVGSAGHFLALTMQQQWQARFIEVPYRAAAQALRDLSAGDIDVLALTTASAARLTSAGTVQALANTEPRRLPCLPQVRTFVEQGMNVEMVSWHGLFVPQGTPEDVVRRLSAELQRALLLPEMQQSLVSSCLTPWPAAPEEARRRLEQDVTHWRAQVRQLPQRALP